MEKAGLRCNYDVITSLALDGGMHCPSTSSCSIDHAKRFFYRPANAIFGKVGRIASEDITPQLINTKCIPILLRGLDACPLLTSDLSSLDFAINRFFYEIIYKQ